MENKQPIWICECGKETVQPPKQPPLPTCTCGKPLRKIKSPDGIINEHFIAPDWFINQFDEQNKRNIGYDQAFGQCAYNYFTMLKLTLENFDNLEKGRKAMQSILNDGAKRLRLSQRKDMKWQFHRSIKRWIGIKVPEVKDGKT